LRQCQYSSGTELAVLQRLAPRLRAIAPSFLGSFLTIIYVFKLRRTTLPLLLRSRPNQTWFASFQRFNSFLNERVRPAEWRSEIPLVDVVLLTKRLAFIEAALEQLDRQSFRDFQLYVGVHADGLSDEMRSKITARGAVVVHVDPSIPFSRALGQLCAAGTSPIVAKWDDDDLYGRDYLANRIAWHLLTRATVSAGVPDLQKLDNGPIFLRPVVSPSSSRFAGGTLILNRFDVDVFDIWGDGDRWVDRAAFEYLRRKRIRLIRQPFTPYVYSRYLDPSHSHTSTEADEPHFIERCSRTGRQFSVDGEIDLGF